MKKFFMILSAMALSVSLVVSCSKDPKPDDGGSIIDDGGEQGGGSTYNDASLKGSSYVPFILDAETEELLGKGKIAVDYRPDDVNRFLYVWDGTYNKAEEPGTNFYGFGGYTSMTVSSVGWSGAGFFAKKDTDPSKKLTGKGWTFHFAYQGPANVAHFIVLTTNGVDVLDGNGNPVLDANGNPTVELTTYKICIGQGSYDEYNSAGQFVKTHTPIAPVSGSFVPSTVTIDADGNVGGAVWNEYEIDLTGTEFFKNGLPNAGCNMVTLSSGGVAGTPIKLDAMFLYKK